MNRRVVDLKISFSGLKVMGPFMPGDLGVELDSFVLTSARN